MPRLFNVFSSIIYLLASDAVDDLMDVFSIDDVVIVEVVDSKSVFRLERGRIV